MLPKQGSLRDTNCSAATLSRQNKLQNPEMNMGNIAMQNGKADGDPGIRGTEQGCTVLPS